MNRIKARTFLVLLSLVILSNDTESTSLSAQENNETELLSFRFRAMVWSGVIKDLYYLDGKDEIPFVATSSNPSKWLTYKGPGPFYIYKKGEYTLNEFGEQIPRPVASFSPQNGQDFLLIMYPQEINGQLSYQIFPLSEESEAIREGLRIVNFTKSEIAIAINNEQALIAPGQQKHLIPEANSDTSLLTKVASNKTGNWKIEYSNLLRERPGIRTTIFVSRPKEKIQIRQFRDQATR